MRTSITFGTDHEFLLERSALDYTISLVGYRCWIYDIDEIYFVVNVVAATKRCGFLSKFARKFTEIQPNLRALLFLPLENQISGLRVGYGFLYLFILVRRVAHHCLITSSTIVFFFLLNYISKISAIYHWVGHRRFQSEKFRSQEAPVIN